MRRTASTVAVVLFLLGGGLAEADPGAAGGGGGSIVALCADNADEVAAALESYGYTTHGSDWLELVAIPDRSIGWAIGKE